ncbi:hypothetical protein HA466_0257040 [Hirschfeldia incana]|nr:hypothetical protein HA466_0257040 [Hirschfeldia incana]
MSVSGAKPTSEMKNNIMYLYLLRSIFSYVLFLLETLSSFGICRVKTNAGTLTNFEVLDLLSSRGASITKSEYKVYDYLMETPACVQTLEIVTNFSDQCQGFRLSKAEILNIINIRPSFTVDLAPVCVDLTISLYQIIYHCIRGCIYLQGCHGCEFCRS